MPTIDPNHSDTLAAFANADLRAAGIDDLRFLPEGFFKSRRAGMSAGPVVTEAELAAQERAGAAQEPQEALEATQPTRTPASALRARCAAILRAREARGKTAAALALALRTDMDPDQARNVLRGMPPGASLDLPAKAIADPAAKAEAARIEKILGADQARGHEDQAAALAFDTDTPPAAALAILGAMPAPVRHASIEERAREMAEFGPVGEEPGGARASSIWDKTVARMNAEIKEGKA